jgi:hypothetical protein
VAEGFRKQFHGIRLMVWFTDFITKKLNWEKQPNTTKRVLTIILLHGLKEIPKKEGRGNKFGLFNV